MAKFQIFVDVRAYFFVSDVDGSMSKQFSAEKIKQPALKRLQQIFQGHHQYNSIQLLELLFIRKSFFIDYDWRDMAICKPDRFTSSLTNGFIDQCKM